jgi:hypothetical protein
MGELERSEDQGALAESAGMGDRGRGAEEHLQGEADLGVSAFLSEELDRVLVGAVGRGSRGPEHVLDGLGAQGLGAAVAVDVEDAVTKRQPRGGKRLRRVATSAALPRLETRIRGDRPLLQANQRAKARSASDSATLGQAFNAHCHGTVSCGEAASGKK